MLYKYVIYKSNIILCLEFPLEYEEPLSIPVIYVATLLHCYALNYYSRCLATLFIDIVN